MEVFVYAEPSTFFIYMTDKVNPWLTGVDIGLLRFKLGKILEK